jgi:hypothetical protein
MAETHQQIKDRLLKTASAIWGYKGVQAEGNFDPLVGLLLGACASELEKISHDIDETRGRALERLVQLLYPEVLSGAIPAHAVAFAWPSEKKLQLPAETPFYVARKYAGAGEGAAPVWKNIYFSPSGGFALQQSAIALMATTQKVYAVKDALQKEAVLHAETGGYHALQNSVWLGISQPENLQPETHFYFELRNEAGKTTFFDSLPLARWHNARQPVSARRGFGAGLPLHERPDPEEIVSGRTSISSRVLRHVNRFYASSFITVSGLQKTPPLSAWPPELEPLYAGADTRELKKENLAWIRIDFPENIPLTRLAGDLHISLNCFPVVNRHLVSMPQKLMNYVNIIPLSSEAFFLDLAEVTDSEGHPLHELHKEGKENMVNLHYGGIERFNEKNAVAAVEGLIQQLRDESSAYSGLGNDFLNSELTALQQSLNKLEQQMAGRQLLKGDTPYLVLPDKEKTGTSNIYVRYWITNGAEGNQVKAGTPLSLYKGADLQSNSILLLTGTAGGRDSLGPGDKVLAYKTALLSKEKLVTAADIASFCRLRLALKDAAVDVTKGYMVHEGSRSGFSKTIDVTVTLSAAGMNTLKQTGPVDFWQQDLALAIENHSNFFMPLRVFIQPQLPL